MGAVPRLAAGAQRGGPQAQIQDRTRSHAVSTWSLGSKLVPLQQHCFNQLRKAYRIRISCPYIARLVADGYWIARPLAQS
jgi:hypothetical protein